MAKQLLADCLFFLFMFDFLAVSPITFRSLDWKTGHVGSCSFSLSAPWRHSPKRARGRDGNGFLPPLSCSFFPFFKK